MTSAKRFDARKRFWMRAELTEKHRCHFFCLNMQRADCLRAVEHNWSAGRSSGGVLRGI